MIAEVQFESPLLRETVREVPAGEVVVEQLDTAEQVPLRAVCWLENGQTSSFEAGLEADRTVADATAVVDTPTGHQYDVKYREQFAGTEFYDAVVEADGIFVSGRRRIDHWAVELRFPSRDAFASCRDRWREAAVEPDIRAIHDHDASPRADQYGISDPQREILLLAAQEGYFDVPRRVSLADLATELDVSSQAASERLRRGLDSLVEQALLTPE